MSERYSAKGTVAHIGETQQVSERFRKRVVVLEIADGRYPQMVPFEITGDRCDEVQFAVGDTVEFEFNLRGRYHQATDRYFGSLEAWRWRVSGSDVSSDGGWGKKEGATPGADMDKADSIPF